MSQKLIDLNDDLRKLRDEGFNVDIEGGCLVVRDIPYVNDQRKVCRGIIVSTLDMNGEVLNPPTNIHKVYFAGAYPCESNGRRITGISLNSNEVKISERLKTQHEFSNKPVRGHYISYYEKITNYAAIISRPAAVLDPSASPLRFSVIEPADDNSPFRYLDTASARAEINMITQKLAVEKLAIVGLGGTGSYVLDLIAKTPVKEIHLFDGDKFSSHNAYRAPGAASIDDLHRQLRKGVYFKEIYSKLHKGIIVHDTHVDDTNVDQLRDMACVFLCVDVAGAKKVIVDKLEEFRVTFIDVGMGLYAEDDALGGKVRVTTSTPETGAIARASIGFGGNEEDDEYDKNIQIADLNALNAILAVIRWKKIRNFYHDTKRERMCSYTISGNLLLNDTDDPD